MFEEKIEYALIVAKEKVFFTVTSFNSISASIFKSHFENFQKEINNDP